MGDYMDGVQLKCSKCGCEGNCDLLKQEIKTLNAINKVLENENEELHRLIGEINEKE